jgi:hypothetical protein
MADEDHAIITLDLDITEPVLTPQLDHEKLSSESAVRALFAQTAELTAKTVFSTILRTIQYGQYHSSPALLLIFDASCQYPGRNRITQAFLTMSFLPLDPSEEDTIASYPIIVSRAPEIFLGASLAESVGRNLNLGLGFTAGNVVQGSVGSSHSHQVERLRGTKITSSVRSAKRRLADTQSKLAFLIEENEPQKRGIPHAFSGACIVSLPQGADGCRMRVSVDIELKGLFSKEGFERVISFWRRSMVNKVPLLKFRTGEEKGIVQSWARMEDWAGMKLADLVVPLEVPKLPEGY